MGKPPLPFPPLKPLTFPTSFILLITLIFSSFYPPLPCHPYHLSYSSSPSIFITLLALSRSLSLALSPSLLSHPLTTVTTHRWPTLLHVGKQNLWTVQIKIMYCSFRHYTTHGIHNVVYVFSIGAFKKRTFLLPKKINYTEKIRFQKLQSGK